MSINHRVLLYGDYFIKTLHPSIGEYMAKIKRETEAAGGTAKFLCSDNSQLDLAFHHALSSQGLIGDTELHSMEYVKSNRYGIEDVTRYASRVDTENKIGYIEKFRGTDTNGTVLKTIPDIESEINLHTNPEYFKFLDKLLVDSCTFAICVYDINNITKRTSSISQLLGMRDKAIMYFKLG